MKQQLVEKEHLIETIKDIQKTLDDILEDVNDECNADYWLMTLLCRVGELESCLTYNFEVKHCRGKRVILKPNRLCECYDKLGGGDQCEV